MAMIIPSQTYQSKESLQGEKDQGETGKQRGESEARILSRKGAGWPGGPYTGGNILTQ